MANAPEAREQLEGYFETQPMVVSCTLAALDHLLEMHRHVQGLFVDRQMFVASHGENRIGSL